MTKVLRFTLKHVFCLCENRPTRDEQDGFL